MLFPRDLWLWFSSKSIYITSYIFRIYFVESDWIILRQYLINESLFFYDMYICVYKHEYPGQLRRIISLTCSVLCARVLCYILEIKGYRKSIFIKQYQIESMNNYGYFRLQHFYLYSNLNLNLTILNNCHCCMYIKTVCIWRWTFCSSQMWIQIMFCSL